MGQLLSFVSLRLHEPGPKSACSPGSRRSDPTPPKPPPAPPGPQPQAGFLPWNLLHGLVSVLTSPHILSPENHLVLPSPRRVVAHMWTAVQLQADPHPLLPRLTPRARAACTGAAPAGCVFSVEVTADVPCALLTRPLPWSLCPTYLCCRGTESPLLSFQPCSCSRHRSLGPLGGSGREDLSLAPVMFLESRD